MGKLILKNNGLETQLINGEDFTTLTPQANTYFLGIDAVNGSLEKLDPIGNIVDYDSNTGGGETFTGGTVIGATEFLDGLTANTITVGVISAATYLNVPSSGGGVVEVTYSELVTKINGSTLTPGTFYLITDFQTCYDQPDFDSSFNPIVGSNYKQGPVEPLVVLALSVNEISNKAFSPSYPNDVITYDWTWDTTEITSNSALGRITERIDDNGNRTDYDHRNILFKRYLESTGGTVYNVIYDNGLPYVEVSTFSGSYHNNFIGDFTNYINFILSNNVFGVDCNNNKIGVNSYNNTIGNNSNENILGNFFIGNTIGDDFESNEIGDYCGNNASYTGTPIQNFIADSFKFNKIGDYFGNDLNFPSDGAGSGGDGGNTVGPNFQNNTIGNNVVMNLFGGDFIGNKIGDYLGLNSFGNTSQDNVIGNYFIGNGGVNGYPNQMGDNFTSNMIGNYAVYNQIENFFNNEFGNFFGNTGTDNPNVISSASNNKVKDYFGGPSSNDGNILYSNFSNNVIYNEFLRNICGATFNGNNINGTFSENKVQYFYNNTIGRNFYSNVIQSDFEDNVFGNSCSYNRITRASNNNVANNFDNNLFGVGFGFYNTGDVTTRDYDKFVAALNGGIGNNIIGRELILHDITSNEYHKVTFTKWTQGGNGGGFKYTRQKVYPSVDSEIIFERPDYSPTTIDIIVPGVLEIKRDNNGGGIYNSAVEGSFNSSVSPSNTEWNSVFTVSTIGNNFNNNKIGDSFQSNEIIGNNFEKNKIGDFFENNQIEGNDFSENEIGNKFFNNEILGSDFSYNSINDYFYSNTNIGVNFTYNLVNSNFYNNTLNDNVNNNTINGDFANNTISYQFQNNQILAPFNSNNINFSFVYNKVLGSFSSNNIGYQCESNFFETQFISNINIGNNFRLNNFKTVINGFNFSSATHVYGLYNCDIFENSVNSKRLSYYDGSDNQVIVNVNS